MKIMCLNGWGGKLHEVLLQYIQTTAPDVLSLQEVVHTPASNKEWLTYRDGDHILLQSANFLRDVCNALPEHLAVFCPAAQGVLSAEEQSIPSQWGLATFIHQSMPIIGQAQGFVHKSFSPLGYGDHPRSRCAHGVRLYDYEADRPISVTHMHGLRDLNGKMDTPERAAQVQKLLSLSRDVSVAGDVSIICGNFNVEPDSETLEILPGAGFSELVTGRGFASTRTSHYKKPVKFADYMLINPDDTLRDFAVIYEPAVSDHCPLILDL